MEVCIRTNFFTGKPAVKLSEKIIITFYFCVIALLLFSPTANDQEDLLYTR